MRTEKYTNREINEMNYHAVKGFYVSSTHGMMTFDEMYEDHIINALAAIGRMRQGVELEPTVLMLKRELFKREAKKIHKRMVEQKAWECLMCGGHTYEKIPASNLYHCNNCSSVFINPYKFNVVDRRMGDQ